MVKPVVIDDAAIILILKDLVANAEARAKLELRLGEVAVPVISLNPLSKDYIADALWDELRTGHDVVIDSFGYAIDKMWERVGYMYADYAKGVPYHYEDTLVGGAFYIPAAGSLIFSAALNVENKLEVYNGNNLMLGVPGVGLFGHFMSMYADGTRLKFKNTDGSDFTLYLDGITI